MWISDHLSGLHTLRSRIYTVFFIRMLHVSSIGAGLGSFGVGVAVEVIV